MKKVKDMVFKDFSEFWSYTKLLNNYQRDILFSKLSSDEQKEIGKSYHDGYWEDLFMRNKIDDVVDGIEKDFGINLINLRIKILQGKSHYMKKSEWKFISDILAQYSYRHIKYLVDGISVEDVDDTAVCLVKS